MAIDQDEFRRVLGHFASGVTVVTVSHDKVLYGITVSSFTSLSLNPPLVLICIDKHVITYGVLQEAGTFAVNILAEDGEHLSRHFASREQDKFTGIAYHTGITGAPLLEDVLATIECRIVGQADGGDHTIFMGEVLAGTTHSGKPLIYFRSGYHELA
ncbi:MAG TPA: flavin reductase family protein [Herpetosiphonaceae bacterium]|nr:flavin reductase family protein [Herpetosiphonaceae bacterium]